MLYQIKKKTPKLIKEILKFPWVIVNNQKKKKAVCAIKIKHEKLLAEVRDKKQIKVVFLVIHKSVWKVDTVFKRMLKDPFFSPEILVCPYISYGSDHMMEEMEQAFSFFIEKGYPVRKSLKENSNWVSLDEMSPDLIFFTNPHNLTRPEYYENAYLHYLTCYVPYYFMATTHAGAGKIEFDTSMLLSTWRIYWPHYQAYECSRTCSTNNGANGLVTGYPSTEKILNLEAGSDRAKNTWKPQRHLKKKIIFSPHHTIENNPSSLSSFLSLADFFVDIAVTKKNQIQFSFKPHPILKSKLYLHPNWGKIKTDKYYEFWCEQENTQLDEGEYEELFIESDAIIHDCSSFIVEYAFTKKPCLYILGENSLEQLLNSFGKEVIKVYQLAKDQRDIQLFIDNVTNESIGKCARSSAFFESYITEFYQKKLPSEKIIDDLNEKLGRSHVNS